MKWFDKEEKGDDCQISNNDGILTAVCKRTIKQKDGTTVSDGQQITLVADPSNDCNISYTGDVRVMDNDGFGHFDGVAKRLQKGCKRASKKGLVSPPKQ